MILLLIYFAIGVILCGASINKVIDEGKEYPQSTKIIGSLIIILMWPVIILLGIGMVLYDAAKKDD